MGEKNLGFLDENSLAVSKEIDETLKAFIDNQKITWKRIIQKDIGCNSTFLDDWKKSIVKTPTKIVKELQLQLMNFTEARLFGSFQTRKQRKVFKMEGVWRNIPS